MNITQVILVAVITTLTILLTYIGIQIAYILKDLRVALQRMNRVMESVEAVSNAVVRPVTGLSSIIEGIQSSVKIAEILGLIKSKAGQAVSEIPARVHDVKQRVEEMHHAALDDEQDTGVDKVLQPQSEPPKRGLRLPRFFHRSGTPLG